MQISRPHAVRAPSAPVALPASAHPPAEIDVPRLVASHRESLLRFAARRAGDRAAAEDLLQEATLRGLGRLRAPSEAAALAWFYRTLANAAIDEQRRLRAERRARAAYAVARAVEPPAAPPGSADAVSQGCLARLAAGLRPAYAEALRRIELDELPLEVYAAEAGITRQNAAVRLFRARQALREEALRGCGGCPIHGQAGCRCGRRR